MNKTSLVVLRGDKELESGKAYLLSKYILSFNTGIGK
jgi:hypothetical protein